jgi:hypothetical protein
VDGRDRVSIVATSTHQALFARVDPTRRPLDANRLNNSRMRPPATRGIMASPDGGASGCKERCWRSPASMIRALTGAAAAGRRWPLLLALWLFSIAFGVVRAGRGGPTDALEGRWRRARCCTTSTSPS